MPINSKAKGNAGEREFAHWLTDNLATTARRGVQYQGSPESPDIHCSLPIHFEVKRVEALNVYKAVEQAVGDCGQKVPAVAHRRNRSEWLITIRAQDLKEFARAILSGEVAV